MTGISTSPSIPTIAGPLILGSQGKNVQTLQSLLNQATVPGPALAVDGFFGIRTDAAVRVFQRRKGLQPDGVVGKLTAQALGAAFVHQPQPLVKPDPPGTLPLGAAPPGTTILPEAFLLGVIAKDLKKIHERLFREIDIDPDPDDEEAQKNSKHAKQFLKNALNQALFILANSARGGLGAQFVAAQVNTAILAMVAGLVPVATLVTRAGGDPSVIVDIMAALNGISLRAAGIVRMTLQGELQGGLNAAKRQLQDLLEPLAD
jgi:hypothetical protein